jgi:hypothetical protein
MWQMEHPTTRTVHRELLFLKVMYTECPSKKDRYSWRSGRIWNLDHVTDGTPNHPYRAQRTVISESFVYRVFQQERSLFWEVRTDLKLGSCDRWNTQPPAPCTENSYFWKFCIQGVPAGKIIILGGQDRPHTWIMWQMEHPTTCTVQRQQFFLKVMYTECSRRKDHYSGRSNSRSVSTKQMHVLMCPVTNGFRDWIILLYNSSVYRHPTRAANDIGCGSFEKFYTR